MRYFRFLFLYLLAIAPTTLTFAQDKLVVVSSTSWQPFSYTTEGNQQEGLLVDMWKEIGKYNNVDIEFIQTDWQSTLNMVKSGEADVQAGLFISEQRKQYLDFSIPLGISFDTKLFVSHMLSAKTMDELRAIPVGFTKGGYASDYVREHYPFITQKFYSGSKEVIQGALNGEIVAFVIDYPDGVHYLNAREGSERFHAVQTLYSEELHAAVRKGSEEVLTLVNESIKALEPEARTEIVNSWIPPQKQEAPIKTIATGTFVLTAGVAIIVYIFYLKRKVRTQNNKLESLSDIDSLTALYNRPKIEKIFHEELLRYQRYNMTFSVVLLEIDNFKEIIEKHGHVVGDAILMEVSELLNESLRSTDYLARWTDQELIIICPETIKHEANLIAEKLRSTIENNTFSYIGICTASFGVTDVNPEDKERVVYYRVESALFDAMQHGNRVIML